MLTDEIEVKMNDIDGIQVNMINRGFVETPVINHSLLLHICLIHHNEYLRMMDVNEAHMAWKVIDGINAIGKSFSSIPQPEIL